MADGAQRRGQIVEAQQVEGLAKPGAGGIVGRPRPVDLDTPLKERTDKYGRKRLAS